MTIDYERLDSESRNKTVFRVRIRLLIACAYRRRASVAGAGGRRRPESGGATRVVRRTVGGDPHAHVPRRPLVSPVGTRPRTPGRSFHRGHEGHDESTGLYFGS